MPSLVKVALFGEDPASLRRIALVLYGAVGPAFVVVLFVVADGANRLSATVAVAGLIVAGAAALAIRSRPTSRWLVFPASVVPIVSCGVAFLATGLHGAAFVAVMMAPIAWAAVLFDGPVVAAAVAVAVATCFVAMLAVDGLVAAILNTIIFATIAGLVAWVGFEKSKALREARESARVEERRTNALLDAIPDVIARSTGDGRFTEIRVPAGDSLPLPVEQMIGRPVYDFLPDSAREPMRAALERAMNSGQPQRFTYSTLYPKGLRSFEATIVKAGEDEIVVIRHDTSASEAAQREHDLLATLVDTMTEGVMTVDLDGIVKTWSAGAAKMYGWTAAEAVGRSVFELTNPGLPADERAGTMKAIVAAGVSRRSGPREGKDGRRLTVELTTVTLQPAEGPAIGVLGVARNVTDIEQARRALEVSESRYRSVVAVMAEGVVLRDAYGRLVTANDAARRILGLTDGQIDGREPLPEGWRALQADGVTPAGLHAGTIALRTGKPVLDARGAIAKPGDGLTWISNNAVPLPTGEVVSTFADITAGRAAQQAELEQARLEGLERRMNEIELVMEAGGRLISVNDRAIQAYGYERDELLAMNVRDLRAPETAAAVAGQMDTAAREGIRFETLHRRKDGSTFPVEVSSRGFEVGGRQYLHSLVRDVTTERIADWQRRALEAEIASALAEREAVLDSSPVGIAKVRDRRILWSNERMTEIFGYSREEMAGASARMLYCTDEQFVEAPARSGPIMAAGSVFYEVQRLRRKDGTDVWAANTGRLVNPADPAAGSIWTFADVSEQKLAERALAESEERYRRLATHATDVIWTMDLETLRYTFISPSIEALRGLTVEQALAEPLDRSLTLESLERVGRQMSMMGRPGGLGPPDGASSITDIFDQPCADGSIKHVEITISPILDDHGRMASILGVSRDVTARVDAERAREKAAAELRDALEHVRTLSGLLPICMYCHRIRNDDGGWERLENYISGHTNAMLSHGMCPECLARYTEEHLSS